MSMVGELETSPHWEDQRRKKPKILTSWEKPPLGRYKLNTDAAIFSDGSTGFRFVVRNNN
ncbi:hypothetical protein ACS0TY_022942 [Phlomoides rotata]